MELNQNQNPNQKYEMKLKLIKLKLNSKFHKNRTLDSRPLITSTLKNNYNQKNEFINLSRVHVYQGSKMKI